MPKVSVLMPIYRTEENYLREAIESILAQTYTDFEFLMIDDCPEDDREAVVKSYKDDRIKYVKNSQNLGITPTRNKLIDMAKGEYLAVFDHDDISLPTRLEKQVLYLDEHPNIGVISCKIQRMSNHHYSKNPSENHEIKLSLMTTCAMMHPSSMIRKSVLEEHHIRYEEEFSPAEDYALWCRLIPYTDFHNLDEVLFKYRDHIGNTSHLQADKMTKATYRIWSFTKTSNPELYEEFLYRSKETIQIKLFGFMPFLKVCKQAQRTQIYLFEKIKLLSVKTTRKLREGM